jgi:hypothetical protein
MLNKCKKFDKSVLDGNDLKKDELAKHSAVAGELFQTLTTL